MARSLSHEAKQLVSSANDLQRLTALEVDKCSKCGLLLNMPLFFKAMEREQPISNANDLKDDSFFNSSNKNTLYTEI